MILGKLEAYLSDDQKVLDYGCATGAIAIGISPRVKEVVGIDISSQMIQLAKSNADYGKVKNVAFVKTAINEAQLKRNSFDLILAFNVLHLLNDVRQDLQRINELLKPGGKFISISACMGEKKSPMTLLFSLLSKLHIAPKINFFTGGQLEDHIKSEDFEIEETQDEFEGKYSYLIIAKKKQ